MDGGGISTAHTVAHGCTMKGPWTLPRALRSLAIPIMPHPETHGGADCVPVSKAETPVAARDLPSVQSGATGSAPPHQRLEYCELPPIEETGTLRQRAERRLFELEAMAELMAADLGEQTPEGRLLACRWAAARALFLEVLELHQPSPETWHSIGHPWDRHEERGLIGRLCQRHGWRNVSPGRLVNPRVGGRG